VLVLHGGPKPSIAPISADQPPINKLELSEANTAFVSAADGGAACLEGVEELPGNLIIWDDGALQDLQVRKVRPAGASALRPAVRPARPRPRRAPPPARRRCWARSSGWASS
jgi:hypothetical protein